MLLAACATGGDGRVASLSSGARYVAMGSSFAAGPGISPPLAETPARCARSARNYAHLLATSLNLALTDVSCSGATTKHLLGPWGDLPPQLGALTPDTKLVTITIGGNDVGYIGSIGSASCRSFPTPPANAPGGKCPQAPQTSESDWTGLDASLRRIVAEVRRRSPDARLIFVDYVTVLPPANPCAAVPLSKEQMEAGRQIANRLARLTQQIATETDAEVLPASSLSRDHSACSDDPWITGFPLPGQPGFVPYHPNARGMAAIAQALHNRLKPAWAGRFGDAVDMYCCPICT